MFVAQLSLRRLASAQKSQHFRRRLLSSSSTSRPFGSSGAASGSAQGRSKSSSSSSASSSSSSSSEAAGDSVAPSVKHWDQQVLARSSFFGAHRPLVAPLDHDAAIAATVSAEELLTSAIQTLSLDHSQFANNSSAVWAASAKLGDVSDHSIESEAYKDQYNDEYAKIFGTFKPFSPPAHPDQLPESISAAHQSNNPILTNMFQNRPSPLASPNSIIHEDIDAQDALDIFFASSPPATSSLSLHFQYTNTAVNRSPRRLVSVGAAQSRLIRSFGLRRSMSLRRRTIENTVIDNTGMSMDQVNTQNTSIDEGMHAIGIKKIRRKKMNKHKLKKRRRLVRNSKRYNKERTKKDGPMREKQE